MTTLLLILFTRFSFAFEVDYHKIEWKILESKNDVTVYKADKIKEIGLVPIKFITPLPYPPAKVLTVLADSNRKHEWVPKMIEGKVIDDDGAFTKIEYGLYDSPWPFKDRTFLVRMSGEYLKDEKTAQITLKSIEDDRVPQNKKHVRAVTYTGIVRIKKLEENKSELEVMFLSDFKGNVPLWIVNFLQKSWPYEMVATVKKQLAREDVVILPRWDIFNLP